MRVPDMPSPRFLRRFATRAGLLVWALATLYAGGYILSAEAHPRAAQTLFWAAPFVVLFLALLHLRCPLRRRFYAGLALTGALAACAIFGLQHLGEQALVERGHAVWVAALEDYLDREYPGWEYDESDAPVHYTASTDAQPGRYRRTHCMLDIRYEGVGYLVFGGVHESAPAAGWQEPIFFVYPHNEVGGIEIDQRYSVRWPSVEQEI